jgi:HSP20 family protein
MGGGLEIGEDESIWFGMGAAANPSRFSQSTLNTIHCRSHPMFIVPLTTQQSQLSRLFDGRLHHLFDSATSATSTPRSPALDVTESDDQYTVTLDLPGVAKEDVKVAVEGRVVTVKAQAAAPKPAAEVAADEPIQDLKKDPARVLYSERSAPRFARRFSLPLEVDQAEAGAKLEHGVLTLTLPKRVARSAAQITIN